MTDSDLTGYAAQIVADSNRWAYLTGYVAQMVAEGSTDAQAIYDYMCELKPFTRAFGDRIALPVDRQE
jgi:hypothetical protein